MTPTASAPSPARRPKLLFLVTEDWYFCSHRLPLARAARDAGFDIVVATRVREHGAQICAEGFALRPLPWRRSGDGVVGGARAIAAIARLYRVERPDIVHHVALKPVLFGGLAARIAYPAGAGAPARVAAVMGLGSGFSGTTPIARWRRPLLRLSLRLAAVGSRVVVQNPEDNDALVAWGVASPSIALIRGSGVDTLRFAAMPEPEGDGLTVALVARMLQSKGVREAVAAIRLLRARAVPVTLLLVGPTDPDNRDSLTEAALRGLAREPGIEWLGRVEDVRTVWRRAAVALLPSYREGLPLALLEAAACARPVIAADVPGCREVVQNGETGLLVPPGDAPALANAIAALAADPLRRRAMGEAGRRLVEREFAAEIVARQTIALYDEALRLRGER